MKSLVSFIKEKLESTTEISNLEIIYTTETGDLLIQVPDNYNEDNIQMYLDDACMPNMPSDPKNSKELFGEENANNIVDAYFQYEELLIPEDSTVKPQVEWNKRYDTKQDRNALLMTYSLKNFEYHVLFDKFEVNNSDLELEEILKDLFMSTESNKIHPWAFTIKVKEINYK